MFSLPKIFTALCPFAEVNFVGTIDAYCNCSPKEIIVRTLLLIISMLAVLIGQGVLATSAQAADFAYVSSNGSDLNNCLAAVTAPNSTTGPCRSFSNAQAILGDGGQIICVDPGYFSAIIITKSITIDCQSGGRANARSVSINAPGKTVTLRNIGIIGINAVSNLDDPACLDIQAAADVLVERAYITEASAQGVRDARTGPGTLTIRDSTITNNAGPAVVIAPAGGTTVAAVLDNVHLRKSSYGLAVGAGGRVMVKRSVMEFNTTAGIEADGGAFIGINDSLVSNNDTGVQANGTVAISNSDINSNNTAISGATQSYGNNRFFANIGLGTAPTPVGSASTDNGQR